MPRFDRTGPMERGPRTGRGLGRCIRPRRRRISFGQEELPRGRINYIEPERAPTDNEMALWDRALTGYQRTRQWIYALKLQYANLMLTHRFARTHSISLEDKEDLAELEQRMIIAVREATELGNNMARVEQLELGVRLSPAGNDLDILQPPEQELSGWIIPVAIGAVIVAGIIARWAYLEREIKEISDRYNGVLMRADQALCGDPTSQTCVDWETTKAAGNYTKRETIIDKVKKAARSIGGTVQTGLGAGLALLIPLLAFMYLPRRKEAS